MTKPKSKSAESAPASSEGPGSGSALPVYVKPELLPDPRRRRQPIHFPAQGKTKQSFAQECDINNIVDRFARTGSVPHSQPGEPQYGDAPDITLFEAACAQAEIRSAVADGKFDAQEPSEAPDDENESETDSRESTPKKPPQGASEALDDESSADGQ